MNLEYAQQIEPVELEKVNFDAIIVASGYESRAIHFSKNYTWHANKKIALGFTDRKVKSRKNNDKVLRKLGFIIEDSEGDKEGSIVAVIKDIVTTSTDKIVNILIDISCMTRVWYGGVINFLKSEKIEGKTVEIYFSYSFANFTNPKTPRPNTYMGPISGFCNIDIPDKPSALVLGLGYEPNRAQGLFEYIEAAESFAFYTEPSLDVRFVDEVKKNNGFVFETFGERIYKYPIKDLRIADALLTNLCLDLRKNYRLILAPLGPKPFILLCLLLSARYTGLDVWRVSSGITGEVEDRVATGEIIVCKAVFLSDSE